MRHHSLWLVGIICWLLASPASAAETRSGQAIFKQTCANCHVEQMPADAHDRRDLIAPPMNLLTTFLRQRTGNSEAAFVEHVVEFSLKPSPDQSKIMPGAIRRFGLMPPIRTIYPDTTREDLEKVAHWLYDRYEYEQQLYRLRKHLRHRHAH